MIVLAEDLDQTPPSASQRDLRATIEAARLVGCRVYWMPPSFESCGTAEAALAHVPAQASEALAVWAGYIPSPERYAAVYNECLQKGIRLLNDPEEHLRTQEFDRAYPFLEGMTPESRIVHDPSECAAVVETIGLPVFVKGAVQSRKSRGRKACVATTLDELETLTRHLLSLEARTRGRVIIRRLVGLRHSRTSPEGFPFGREYRVFVYRERVLAWGYYWEGDDPLRLLTPAEEADVLALARTASRNLQTPYISADIGQQDNGDWIVIETGDGQFSGASQTPLFQLWNALNRL